MMRRKGALLWVVLGASACDPVEVAKETRDFLTVPAKAEEKLGALRTLMPAAPKRSPTPGSEPSARADGSGYRF